MDSRSRGFAIRRRRECQVCKRRYTTFERTENEPRLRIVKKDGRRETYDRAKVRQGLVLALHKRPVPTERLDEMIQEIEDELTAKYAAEIPSRAIGDLVMEKLKKEDQVAYVRFASIYRNFKDVSEFVHEVEPMLKQGGPSAPEKSKDRRRGSDSRQGAAGPEKARNA
jgi:transcriptional repressor NrdR